MAAEPRKEPVSFLKVFKLIIDYCDLDGRQSKVGDQVMEEHMNQCMDILFL